MKVQLAGLCRGEGLVYFKFEIGNLSANAEITALVQSHNGLSLPSKCFKLRNYQTPESKHSVVVVTPLLDDSPTEIILSTKSEADSTNRVQFSYSPQRIKWESRFTYRLKRNLASEIRDIEKQDIEKNASLVFEYALPDADQFLIRGKLTLPACDSQDISFTAIDNDGKPVNCQPCIISNYTIPLETNPSIVMREQHFSMRVPRDSYGLTLLVQDKSNPEVSGFRSLGKDLFYCLLEGGAYFWRNACVDPSYNQWFLKNRAKTYELAAQQNRQFDNMPVFSIVVPLYKTPLPFFSAMLESVLNQSYKNWELILVNASSDDLTLSNAVTQASSNDGRIRYTSLKENLGITENTNVGIAASTGDYVCFLDHDDTLEPDCLYEYADAINQHPDTDLLYCDEDKIDEAGKNYSSPFFKTDFDIDLLRSHNYVCHLLCVRKSMLDELGPFSNKYDGAQDHNLTLRIVEKAKHIHHVKKILYHWRVTENSTASAEATSRNVKGYANDAGKLAIEESLERLSIPAIVEPGPAPYSHHVKYLVQNNPLVSIIIPNKDCSELLKQCVNSLINNTNYQNFEIIIVENNSTEPETQLCYKHLKELDSRLSVVIWEDVFNFSKIINYGASFAKGDYLLLLNNDTEALSPEWLENMLGVCQRSDVGIVGAKLLYPDRTIQHAGVIVGKNLPAHHAAVGMPESDWGYFGRTALMHQCSAVTGACLLTKHEVFNLVGGFDEELAIAYNDVDYCFKVRKQKLAVVYEPTAQLIHYESVSRGIDNVYLDKTIRNKQEGYLLMSRWARLFVEGDPFFNPNLETNFFRLRQETQDAIW